MLAVNIKSTRPIAVAIVSTVLLCSAAADICVDETQKIRRVSGLVVDANNYPIANVKVTLLKNQTAERAAKTTDDGTFVFGELPPGDYELDFSIPMFRYARYRITVTKAARISDILRIEMAVGGVTCEGNIRTMKQPTSAKNH